MWQSLQGCLTKLDCDKAAGRAGAVFLLPADFPAFAGHFPGQPVFPAFAQLVAVRLVATSIVGCALLPVQTGKIKFMGMVGPAEEIRIQVSMVRHDDNWRATFSITQGTDKIAAGTIIYDGIS